jgi:hypothetical protein
MSVRVTEYLVENVPVGPTETAAPSKPHSLAFRTTHSVRSTCDGDKSNPETVTTCPSSNLAEGESEIVGGAGVAAPTASDVLGKRNKTTTQRMKPPHQGLTSLRLRNTPAGQIIASIRMDGLQRRNCDPELPRASRRQLSPDEWLAARSAGGVVHRGAERSDCVRSPDRRRSGPAGRCWESSTIAASCLGP